MAMDKKEFCEFYEQLLKAQLSVVRQFSGQTTKRKRIASKGRSQIDLTEDILKSALTKKVKKGDRFVRVAPNTFALAAKSGQ
jgi:hypothetical protein